MARIAQIFVVVVALVSVLFVIYGGFKYATSGGDETKVAEARKTITYGVIGLAVALLSFAVIAFTNSLVADIAR